MNERIINAIDLKYTDSPQEREYVLNPDYCLYRLFTDSNNNQEEIIVDFKNGLELKPTTWLPVTLHWGVSIQEVDYYTDELGCEGKTNFFIGTGIAFKRLNQPLWEKYIKSWLEREINRMDKVKSKLQEHIC